MRGYFVCKMWTIFLIIFKLNKKYRRFELIILMELIKIYSLINLQNINIQLQLIYIRDYIRKFNDYKQQNLNFLFSLQVQLKRNNFLIKMIQNLLANQLTLSQSLCEWDVIHQKMKQKMTISQAKLYQKVKKSPNQSECRHMSMTQKEKYFFDKGIHHIQRQKEKLQKPSIPLKIEQKKLSKKIQSNRGINQLLYEKALNIVAYQLQSTKQSENSAQNNKKVFLKKNQIIQKQIRCYNRLVQRSRIKSGTTRKRSASIAAQNIIIQKKSNERKSFKQLKKENQKKLRMALGSSLSIQRIKLVSQSQSTDLSQQKQKMSQCEDRKPFKTQQFQIKSKIKQGKKSITALLNTIKSKINPNNYKAFPKQKLIL